MKNNNGENTRFQLLFQRFKKTLRISENANYYSKQDYEIAEEKFLKSPSEAIAFKFYPPNSKKN